MAEQGNRTFMTNMYDPEVLADMISAKLEKKVRVTPYAKVDTTLQGRAGTTITIPRFNYTGSASVVGEGEEIPVHKLTTASVQYTVKKIGDAKTITDEAILSGYGDPVGESTKQLGLALADYIDSDLMGELEKASKIFEATSKISYNNVVDTIALFGEEVNTPKVIFVHPDQVATLRKDSNFISADKYGLGTNVILNGEIGMICNTRVVSSKRVEKNSAGYQAVASTASGALKVVASGASSGEINISDITKVYPASYSPAVNDYVGAIAADTYYMNPIVRLSQDDETEDETPAITIFMKRGVDVETERETLKRQTIISADEHYVAALTNDGKVALMFAKVSG